jgi:hypothetical protein
LKAGPVHLKAEVGVINGKASVESNGELLSASAVKLKGEAEFGGNKASVSGELLKGSVNLGREGAKFDGKLADGSGEASRGGYNIDNSAIIGVSGKLSVLEVEGNINLGHAAMGAVHLVEAGVEYIQGKWSEYFSKSPRHL